MKKQGTTTGIMTAALAALVFGSLPLDLGAAITPPLPGPGLPGTPPTINRCALYGNLFYRLVDIQRVEMHLAMGAHRNANTSLGEPRFTVPYSQADAQPTANLVFDLPHPECMSRTFKQEVVAGSTTLWVNGVKQAVPIWDHQQHKGAALPLKPTATSIVVSGVKLGLYASTNAIKLRYVEVSSATRFSFWSSTGYAQLGKVPAFLLLNTTYDSKRCQYCHIAGSSQKIYDLHQALQYDNHPSTPIVGNGGRPDTPDDCSECHAEPIARQRAHFIGMDPTARGDWQSPAFSKDINWSQITSAQDRCNRTVQHLANKLTYTPQHPLGINLGLANNVYEHFLHDPRLIWAVTDGAPHGRDPEYDRILPTAWPHFIGPFGDVIQAWIDSGVTCDLSPGEGYYRFWDLGPSNLGAEKEPADYYYP